MSDPRPDVVVIGAGFGGLGAALRLAEAGARVTLCETLSYPGGCASTFERDGFRFEAGATLFSGFAPGQLFHRWIVRHGLKVDIEWADPIAELRTPDRRLAIPRSREEFERLWLEMPSAPRAGLRRLFQLQRRVADTLWPVLDDPALLPPFGPGAWRRHAGRLPGYLRLAPLLGVPLGRLLERYGLSRFEPLTTYLDAVCQITVQCSASEAEAPFALSVLDYWFRGTGHVRGGIGRLAHALVEAVRRQGGEVSLTDRVRGLRRGVDGRWQVEARRGTRSAAHVVANLLPQDLRRLVHGRPLAPSALEQRVAEGWGACMLYLVARAPEGFGPAPMHVEIVQDPGRPFVEGNHLFCSIGSDGDGGVGPGRRTVTVSTHVPMAEIDGRPEPEVAERIAAVQATMRSGLAAHAPEWSAGIEHALTASPRTFARFTGRHRGLVGGIPRRAGLHHYVAALRPPALPPGLHLVGDSVFPGQSTLATAVGGHKVADRVLRRLGR